MQQRIFQGVVSIIYSYQNVSSDLTVPHITIECESYEYNEVDNSISGNWMNGASFSIQLIDSDDFSPTIDNIQFVPEPASLILLGFGGLLLRRKY